MLGQSLIVADYYLMNHDVNETPFFSKLEKFHLYNPKRYAL